MNLHHPQMFGPLYNTQPSETPPYRYQHNRWSVGWSAPATLHCTGLDDHWMIHNGSSSPPNIIHDCITSMIAVGKPANTNYSAHLVISYNRRFSPLRGLTSSSCGGLLPLAEAIFFVIAKKRACYAVLAQKIQNNPKNSKKKYTKNLPKFKKKEEKIKKSERISKLKFVPLKF